MTGGAVLERALRAPRHSEGPALVAYLTAGFPSRDSFARDLLAVATVADVIEIGVPFSDPMADGVTIQRASHAALIGGASLGWILQALRTLAARPPVPLVLMSYLNPLLALSLTRLPALARAAGIAGFVVPDLPLEEAGELEEALAAEGLALVRMVSPVTPAERLAALCLNARGFVYAVSATGTTGRSLAPEPALLEYLDGVRNLSGVPVCAGFGIRARSQLDALRGHVDGVVVGSALVEVLERGEDPVAFLHSLRG
jgi:tryptophan synthase alpha chain